MQSTWMTGDHQERDNSREWAMAEALEIHSDSSKTAREEASLMLSARERNSRSGFEKAARRMQRSDRHEHFYTGLILPELM